MLRRIYRILVRICLVVIIGYVIDLVLLLDGRIVLPNWWLWSIILWILVPYWLMQLDLRAAAELSQREKEEWKRHLVSFGLGAYIVPFFYFLATRIGRGADHR